jgi:hypothetical protein
VNIRDAILRAVDKKQNRGYDKLYWAIDLHNSIIRRGMENRTEEEQFFPYAIPVLQILTHRSDMVLILFTSSTKETADHAIEFMRKFGIYFDYVNCNPDFPSNDLYDFSTKFAFDVMVEDKAGFNGETDWKEILETLKKLNLMGIDAKKTGTA